MSPSTRKWQALPTDQRVEVGLVQVDIGWQSKQHDSFAGLILKNAKDVLKDALLAIAERRGGKLLSWEDNGGTFLFPVEGADSLDNCCLAALDMLETLPLVKQQVELSGDLERLCKMGITCDCGTAPCEPHSDGLPGEVGGEFPKHEQAVGTANKVAITERIFQRLSGPVQSRFVKWQHSTEPGLDLYLAAEGPITLEFPLPALSATESQPRQDGLVQKPGTEKLPVQPWTTNLPHQVLSRKTLGIGAAVLFALLVIGLVRFFWPAPPAVPAAPAWAELVHSDEWLTWRKQIHEKLCAGTVNEQTLADALKIKLPARPDDAPAVLRRDQAIADVLMTYADVKLILKKRFGIHEESFLGTGLSKPFSTANYETACVHEYLIPNHADNHPLVWMLILDPTKNQLHLPIAELFEKESGPDEHKKQLAEAIARRVKDRDSVSPAVIRFAMLNASDYSRKLGRLERKRVFASNLAEVWNLGVREAANLSGHTFTHGDSVYVWAFLPNHPDEVVPATWGEVVKHLPRWLSDDDTN